MLSKDKKIRLLHGRALRVWYGNKQTKNKFEDILILKIPLIGRHTVALNLEVCSAISHQRFSIIQVPIRACNSQQFCGFNTLYTTFFYNKALVFFKNSILISINPPRKSR